MQRGWSPTRFVPSDSSLATTDGRGVELEGGTTRTGPPLSSIPAQRALEPHTCEEWEWLRYLPIHLAAPEVRAPLREYQRRSAQEPHPELGGDLLGWLLGYPVEEAPVVVQPALKAYQKQACTLLAQAFPISCQDGKLVVTSSRTGETVFDF